VSLFLLSGSLHLRGQEAPFYGHGELAGHESTMWQLELAAQMKIGALTILTLIVAAFAVSGDARRTAARLAERATRNGQACAHPRAHFVRFRCCSCFLCAQCLTLVLAVQLDSIRHGHLQRVAALQAQLQRSRRQSISVSREELP
jgi:hypothetical protein